MPEREDYAEEYLVDDETVEDVVFTEDDLSPEDWQDWHSEELLNAWMSVVEYHEQWYLPLRRTFNQFCEFVYNQTEPVVNAADHYSQWHWLPEGYDWNYFFSLGYK